MLKRDAPEVSHEGLNDAESFLGRSTLHELDSEEARQALNISNVEYIRLDRSALRNRYAYRLGIRKTPVYVVLDHRGVVLETTDAEDIPAFLQQRAIGGSWTADDRRAH